MDKTTKQFDTLLENEINNTESAYKLLEQHQINKKGKKLKYKLMIDYFFTI